MEYRLNIKLGALFILLVCLFNSCSYVDKFMARRNSEDILVTIGDNHLYKKDIETLVPKGTNSTDSALIVEGYIKRWATNVLILENAERNVTNSTEINKLVEDYKKTLLVHYYQQNMVNENVDEPTDKEAIKFYNNNPQLFTLKSPAIKGALISVPQNVEIKNIKKNFQNIENDIDIVEKFAVSYANKYILFNEQWKTLKEIKTNISIPLNIDKVGYYEFKDSSNIILINITSYIPKGEVAPQEMVIEESRQELYNQDKMNYIKNFGNNIYDYALRHGQIKINKHKD